MLTESARSVTGVLDHSLAGLANKGNARNRGPALHCHHDAGPRWSLHRCVPTVLEPHAMYEPTYVIMYDCSEPGTA